MRSSSATSMARLRSFSFSRTPVGPVTRKILAASATCIMTKVESYSKCPESKVPTTVTCLKRGATPAGVICPLGATSVTASPSCTPMTCANCLPSTTPNSPGTNRCKVASFTAAMLVTPGSRLGSMPRTITPRMVSPCTSSDCPVTNGAAATTCGCLRASAMVAAGSGNASSTTS